MKPKYFTALTRRLRRCGKIDRQALRFPRPKTHLHTWQGSQCPFVTSSKTAALSQDLIHNLQVATSSTTLLPITHYIFWYTELKEEKSHPNSLLSSRIFLASYLADFLIQKTSVQNLKYLAKLFGKINFFISKFLVLKIYKKKLLLTLYIHNFATKNPPI